MSRLAVRPCPWEHRLLEAIHAGLWPDSAEVELRAHVGACEGCAAVAELACALRADLESVMSDAAPPTSSVMWWRLEQRARRDAARAASRPVAMAQGLALACLCGLVVGLAGVTWQWLHPWLAWFGAEMSAVPSLTALVAGRPAWLATGGSLAALALLVLGPVALYLALADE